MFKENFYSIQGVERGSFVAPKSTLLKVFYISSLGFCDIVEIVPDGRHWKVGKSDYLNL